MGTKTMVSFDKWTLIRWGGTMSYMIGMVLNSLNVYPINIIFCMIGGACWAMQGFKYKDRALILVEVTSAVVYASGLIWWMIK